MEKALVTGAAGFIGSHLVDELLDRGWEVRGLDDLTTGDISNLEQAGKSDSFTLVKGDVRDRTTVMNAIGEADVIFHQAAFTSVPGSFEEPIGVTTRNCTGTATVMDIAVDQGVENIVLASSAAVYGSGSPLPKIEDHSVAPESPYAATKYYTEEMAQQIGNRVGIDVVALRYFNVFGPRQDPDGEYAAVIPKFINLILKGDRPIIFGDGEQSRDFIFVKDVVDANISAAKTDISGVFNVASGTSVTINELVSELNRVSNADVEPIYKNPRPGDIRHSKADISKAREAIGFKSAVSFHEGVNRTVKWFKNTHH